MTDPNGLKGRHALVTGGGSGIGAAIAAALAGRGATVTVVGRTEARLAETVAAGRALAYAVADVTKPDRLEAAFARLVADHGPIDILVNNAGAAESAPFARTDRAMWDRMIGLNLGAVYEATRLVLPGMIERGWGRIVNVASIAGLAGYPYVAAYCAAKHGVVGLTRALAREVAAKGVTVNAVCPGYTDTELVRDAVTRIEAKTGRKSDEILAEFTRVNPQGRLVLPEEVAAAVAWLAGPDAASANGIALPIAGGEVT
ncbi:NAD(P)-dependent dehydrogenase (short-subunit alcohol dehydrogenase family) [Inquilinus ginsengisoli]|uniref:NAD(P)-dependent dehydrogenase (Short-subunit alcohol dehydrogenase family) n=1 Tax=Inquilinus ginsengisoli TaxID=363840 RepID=A0ABU1JKN8_9PROT|nr:3-oxoacyl-ACP reductase FabG [Inquilinus ginsengisoli]MDR6289181.1 NAD(P)-dependent dehydrogenase (short-subunit alcohol dehydrogenase family) [Inquilinus ginsengisoli]